MHILINSYFAKNGIPKTGLSPTIKIWEVSDTLNTLIVTDDNMSEVGDGFYKYVFTDTNGYDENKNYVLRSDANDITLSNSEKYSVGSISEVTIPNSVITDITSSVWDETATDHINAGSTGFLLNKISADTTQLEIESTIQISLLELLLKYERNKTAIDKSAYTMTIFDDDGITPLTIFDLKDANNNPSIVEICKRIPQ